MEENTNNKRKQKIIDAAIKVLKKKSAEEATVREIAAMAGLTTGAIYHHYKNKNELLYDVINQSVHFSYKFSELNELSKSNQKELLSEIQSEIALRLSKADEQKLHILLLSDVIAKDGIMKKKYASNYNSIIKKTADLFYFAFGIENENFKNAVSAILVAALDGIAIQQSLGVLPENQADFIKVFNDFFSEIIPIFLERHMDNDIKK